MKIGQWDRVATPLSLKLPAATLPRLSALMLLILALTLTALPAAAQSGKQDYDKYCADCHGPEGKGNGSALSTIPMNPPPPDLTLLAAKNGGKFPFQNVVDIIDGRKNIPSHERIQMPFLGTTLQEPGKEFTPESDAAVKQRIESMARYVESLQRK
jgi:mono/diheme cytochrome c family protein